MAAAGKHDEILCSSSWALLTLGQGPADREKDKNLVTMHITSINFISMLQEKWFKYTFVVTFIKTHH